MDCILGTPQIRLHKIAKSNYITSATGSSFRPQTLLLLLLKPLFKPGNPFSAQRDCYQ